MCGRSGRPLVDPNLRRRLRVIALTIAIAIAIASAIPAIATAIPARALCRRRVHHA